MNLKRSPFYTLDKERGKIEYIKRSYKKKIHTKIESHKNSENEDKQDTIQALDILMLDRISI